METNDLGSKKMNNKESAASDLNAAPKLQSELEIDAQGHQKIVERARQVANDTTSVLKMSDSVHLENENETRGVVTDAAIHKTIENKDRNSDVTPHRYPNATADNHEDRGNIKLDN
jgi:hypothetical protein